MGNQEIAKKIILVAAGLVVVLILMVSITLAYAGRDVSLMADRYLHLSFNGYNVEVPLAEDGATYDAPCLTAETANRIKLINDPGATVKINGKGMSVGQNTKVDTPELAYNQLLTIEVSNAKDKRTIYFRTLSSRLPELSATGESDIEGDYYLTDYNAPNMYKLNARGEVVYYLALDPKTEGDVRFMDFKKHVLENGDVRYSYHRSDPDYKGLSLSGYTPGHRVILNQDYEDITPGDLQKLYLVEGEYTRAGHPADGHDFILLADNHYLIEGYVAAVPDNLPAELKGEGQTKPVVGAVIQEVRNGELVNEWASFDYPELYSANDTGANFQGDNADYFHLNAMVIDPADENLIVSSRNTSTILKLDRETGELLWQLGGKGDAFGLTPEQKMTNQGDVRLTEEGELTIFDNGRAEGGSRVLKLTLDEKAKKVTSYEAFTVPGHFTSDGGSAVWLEDKTFALGWGHNDTGRELLSEYNFLTGKEELVVKIKGDGKTFGSYRAAKYE